MAPYKYNLKLRYPEEKIIVTKLIKQKIVYGVKTKLRLKRTKTKATTNKQD